MYSNLDGLQNDDLGNLWPVWNLNLFQKDFKSVKMSY